VRKTQTKKKAKIYERLMLSNSSENDESFMTKKGHAKTSAKCAG